MALGMSLLGCLLLACALNLGNGQTLQESVFKVLTAAELRAISLQQNPELLEFAARTGETVRVEITAAQQGAIVQEGVNTILDCGPWLRNFPGGTVKWFKYGYRDIDHTDLLPKTEQNPANLSTPVDSRSTGVSIEGQYNEIFRITRGLIADDAEDPSRGIYECQVCIAREIDMFEVCHSANTTVANAGRAPIIDSGVGRNPSVTINGVQATYKIGSSICLNVHPTNPRLNVPLQTARLQCQDIGGDLSQNIPVDLPLARITWEHTSPECVTAFFAINRLSSEVAAAGYMPPMEFTMRFPGLVGPDSPFSVSTDAGGSLDFSIDNITSNASNTDYQNLRMAFGSWACTLNNTYGSQTSTSFISDMCGNLIPSIDRNCEDIGDNIGGGLYFLDTKARVPVRAGCDVCVPYGVSLALTLTCPININIDDKFPDVSIVRYEWTSDNDTLGTGSALTVNDVGSYTCRVFFSDGSEDSATSTITRAPDIQLSAVRTRQAITFETSGCERLRFPDRDVEEGDFCPFFDSARADLSGVVTVSCTSRQNITVSPYNVSGMMTFNGRVVANRESDGTVVTCELQRIDDPTINQACAGINRITIHTYEPARIIIDTQPGCSISAGAIYNTLTPVIDTVVICCDVIGYPEPVKEWYRIRRGANGIPVEDLVENLTIADYSIDPDTHRLTISNYNSARDDGTYVCRGENIAGIDVASAAIGPRPTVGWRVSEWCDCDPFCRNGTRSRKVWCELIPGGVVVLDSFCTCAIRPAEVESCFNVPGLDQCFLTPLWKTGEFSRCSKGCEGGFKVRDVYCALPRDGSRVPDSRCIELYGAENTPPSYDICFNECCYSDVYPEYCSNSGTNQCGNPIFQQNCCWSCGLSVRG